MRRLVQAALLARPLILVAAALSMADKLTQEEIAELRLDN
jgi:hypothetical protein